MINKELTDFISKKLNISRRDSIEKDVIISKLLCYLTQDKDFFQNYAFKGGTCLTKCYLGYYRFSEDLDFTYLNREEFVEKSKKKIRELISEKIEKLGKLIEVIAKKLDLDFKIEKENKRYVQFGGGNVFVTYKIWYKSEELQKETFVKIQVNHLEKLNYPINELNAGNIVPNNLEKDFSFLAHEETEILFRPAKVKAYDIKEILIEKIRAILTRRGIKIRDFVDVFLITEREKLDLNNFKREIIEKINDMLKYEKYLANIENKEKQLREDLVFEEEENITLKPLPHGFDKFIDKIKPFLKEVIKEVLGEVNKNS